MSIYFSTDRVTPPSNGSDSARARGSAADAFAGGKPPTVAIQVAAILRDERGQIVASGVPRTRAQQVLSAVLSLRCFREVPKQHLHLEIHRSDEGKYRHHFGLAMAIATISALGQTAIPEACLFLGDVCLDGQIQDVPAELVDRLNAAISDFSIETPLTVVLAPDSAAWINASSTVRVIPVRSLMDVVKSIWPGVAISAF